MGFEKEKEANKEKKKEVKRSFGKSPCGQYYKSFSLNGLFQASFSLLLFFLSTICTFKIVDFMGSGCVSVDRMVASDS